MKPKQLKMNLGHKLTKSVLIALMAVSFPFSSIVNVSAMAGMGVMAPGTTPDYYGTPNYANSPLPELDAKGNVIPGTGIRKFVDSLPGLGAANANDLGQYLPVAIPDTTTYPGSDYYEISLVEYTEKLHKDLPATKLRGYKQTNTTDATVSKPSYFGPVINAQKDRPVRVKFTNNLPTGSGGDLFLPVDTTIMGAGMGPDGKNMYTQNRGLLHLHGGITPWISDGTPHQWVTPAGENTPYPKGVSVQNVPDMPDPGPGSMTYFYTNQQSARMMWYHDHSYGITRLNVYAGEAAPYMLRDQVEKDLIAKGIIPADEIPLIIQDKTFVPKDAQLAATDPTWDKAKWGGMGQLWFPHVYMPNQNPYVTTGANNLGRWDYGPWFWPPNTGLLHGPVPNPLKGQPGQGDMNPGVPNVSQVPEAFMDTPLVNGTAYPYLNIQPKAYRFRILNASNDRMWNLQLYKAKSNGQMWNADGTLKDGNAGEVPIVPAVQQPGFPSTWPNDNRPGGVPDPSSAGPNMIQIGTDSGFLPKPVELINQPIDYEYSRRIISTLNITSKTLLLGPAERADVVVDFSKYAGQTLILYNDAPAPGPFFDPRYDYYTGDPDQSITAPIINNYTGGAPTTLPGYGPNTRTVMQIKVADNPSASGRPLSSVSVTNGGTGYTSVPNVSISDSYGTGAAAKASLAVDKINVTSPGNGYTASPAVSITGGGATTDAAAKATISVDGLKVGSFGSGYTTAPSVSISDSGGGTGSGATGKAALSVTGIQVTNPGAGYSSAPAVTVTDSIYGPGSGSGATAVAAIDSVQGIVTGITVTNPGNGYIAPIVTLSGGGATTPAAATVTGSVYSVTLTHPGTGYTAPVVTLSGGGATAPASVTVTGSVYNITITSAGAGYTSLPTVTLTGGNPATPGSAQAALKVGAIAVTSPGSGYVNPTVTITGGGGSGAAATANTTDILQQLQAAIPAAFEAGQNPLLVPDTKYVNIMDTSITFTPPKSSNSLTLPLEPKAIAEEFTQDYGRMNAVLGMEIPNTNFKIQTTILQAYIDPATEILKDVITPMTPVQGDGTQIWKVTHNGVDTHSIHFHLFDVQLINRVGWDGSIRFPDDNERGWKDTVRMNPLEDAIVALRPIAPKLPFGLPDSIRPLDPTMPLGTTTQFSGIDPKTGNAITVVNQLVNFGWEYVWHCHLLGHEENDMMRPMILNVARAVPAASTLSFSRNNSGGPVSLSWTDPTPASDPKTLGNPSNEVGYKIQRAAFDTTGQIGTYTEIGTALANATGYTDTTVDPATSYSYKVVAYNAAGNTESNVVTAAASNIPSAPTNLTAAVYGAQVNLTWTDNAINETGFTVERAVYGTTNFTSIANPGPHNGVGIVTFSDTSVAAGSSYSYRVNAVNGALSSAYSNVASIDVPGGPVAPATPTNFTSRVSAGTTTDSVALRWNASTGATQYVIQRALDAGFTQGLNTVTTSATLLLQTNLPKNTTYYYRIQAVNLGGSSAWSAALTVKTP
ncbi:multicopper oxidase domain-containing protein [Paenibacillus sp. GP183]|uniref:fibronectin type III domain-containing protein n=1 Tax=Paenibacillus sp. GP183 TaxID=1882751 RepID=UPI000B866312|nr:multicopper oxidase domain-containing protein [Paenibacillus sp. GP183]